MNYIVCKIYFKTKTAIPYRNRVEQTFAYFIFI